MKESEGNLARKAGVSPLRRESNELTTMDRGRARSGRGSGSWAGHGPSYDVSSVNNNGNSYGYQYTQSGGSGDPSRMVAGGQHLPRHWTPTSGGNWQPRSASAVLQQPQQYQFGQHQQGMQQYQGQSPLPHGTQRNQKACDSNAATADRQKAKTAASRSVDVRRTPAERSAPQTPRTTRHLPLRRAIERAIAEPPR